MDRSSGFCLACRQSDDLIAVIAKQKINTNLECVNPGLRYKGCESVPLFRIGLLAFTTSKCTAKRGDHSLQLFQLARAAVTQLPAINEQCNRFGGRNKFVQQF